VESLDPRGRFWDGILKHDATVLRGVIIHRYPTTSHCTPQLIQIREITK